MMFREDTVVRVVTLDAVEGKSVLLREVVEDPAWAAAVDASLSQNIFNKNKHVKKRLEKLTKSRHIAHNILKNILIDDISIIICNYIKPESSY